MQQNEPKTKFSDNMNNGVVIGFEDGKMAFFPARLLYAMLPQAESMPPNSKIGYPPKEETTIAIPPHGK